jgi:hypothetical protein
MTGEELIGYLRENGFSEAVVRSGPTGLVERWRKFVEEVERGYKSGLEDYRKELDIRGILAMLELDDSVQDLDQRLAATLISRDQRVWESSAADPFWDFGYPRDAGNQLMEDLRKEGLTA